MMAPRHRARTKISTWHGIAIMTVVASSLRLATPIVAEAVVPPRAKEVTDGRRDAVAARLFAAASLLGGGAVDGISLAKGTGGPMGSGSPRVRSLRGVNSMFCLGMHLPSLPSP